MRRLPIVAAIFCLFAAAIAAHGADPSARSGQDKPNILVIWGNDIGWSNFSVYHRGMMGCQTPDVDKLAAQAAYFTDLYAENSCTAGRNAAIRIGGEAEGNHHQQRRGATASGIRATTIINCAIRRDGGTAAGIVAQASCLCPNAGQPFDSPRFGHRTFVSTRGKRSLDREELQAEIKTLEAELAELRTKSSGEAAEAAIKKGEANTATAKSKFDGMAKARELSPESIAELTLETARQGNLVAEANVNSLESTRDQAVAALKVAGHSVGVGAARARSPSTPARGSPFMPSAGS